MFTAANAVTYTFPLATVGGLNFARLPTLSRIAFFVLSKRTLLGFIASIATSLPLAMSCHASPGGLINAAQMMAVPSFVPFDDRVMMPPGWGPLGVMFAPRSVSLSAANENTWSVLLSGQT